MCLLDFLILLLRSRFRCYIGICSQCMPGIVWFIVIAWSKRWLLQFNATKCFVLRIRQSLSYLYTLNGHALEVADSQRDLGVIISNNLKPHDHVGHIVTKANQRLGLIKRCFSNLVPLKLKTLYVSLIRPILEYGSPAWNPWHVSDINRIEKVQKRCQKLCHPTNLELPPLQDRRHFIDLCEVYKYLHNMYKTPPSTFFSVPQRMLRGHSYKLQKQYARTDVRKHFFSHRVVDAWNALPEEVVSAPTLTSFKNRLRSQLFGRVG